MRRNYASLNLVALHANAMDACEDVSPLDVDEHVDEHTEESFTMLNINDTIAPTNTYTETHRFDNGDIGCPLEKLNHTSVSTSPHAPPSRATQCRSPSGVYYHTSSTYRPTSCTSAVKQISSSTAMNSRKLSGIGSLVKPILIPMSSAHPMQPHRNVIQSV